MTKLETAKMYAAAAIMLHKSEQAYKEARIALTREDTRDAYNAYRYAKERYEASILTKIKWHARILGGAV